MLVSLRGQGFNLVAEVSDPGGCGAGYVPWMCRDTGNANPLVTVMCSPCH